MRNVLLALLLVAVAVGCEQKKSKLDDFADQPHGGKVGDAIDIDSKDILNRKESASNVWVKHILIAWKDLDGVYQGHMDKRAQARTNEEAVTLARDLYQQLRAKPDKIDELVKEHSEDPGSASGDPYQVKAETQFVPEFKALALKLKEKEVGIVRSKYGYHVMERVAAPAPDPLESADILARPAETGQVNVQHVLIGWKDTPAAKAGRVDDRAKNREKAEADKIATEVMTKAKAGEDFKGLMKQYSEDPGSKDDGRVYPVAPDAPMVEPFKDLSLRLKMGEVGMVKSPFGWHVIKRVEAAPPPPPPPPPAPEKPDPLDSADILKRAPTTKTAEVKHILLGWKDQAGGGDDPRGQKRDRATLEKQVKELVARLKKGEKIEPLMKEFSEDPGSAEKGSSYPVDENAAMVAPFKNLSLRLNVNEVGVVKSQFGIHIIQRVK
ncbi:MAG TPA: peptidylprolyl isomerase [Kofleriaceae bacterium]|nr:peptidylprolyl isomerase [Kofleriaceae bacterium]